MMLHFGKTKEDHPIDKLAELSIWHQKIIKDINKSHTITANNLAYLSSNSLNIDHDFCQDRERQFNDAVVKHFQDLGYEVSPLLLKDIHKREKNEHDYSFDGLFAAEKGVDKLLILVTAKTFNDKDAIISFKKNAAKFKEMLTTVNDETIDLSSVSKYFLQQCNYLSKYTHHSIVLVCGAHKNTKDQIKVCKII